MRIRHGAGVAARCVCAADESDPWQVEAWLLVGRHWRVVGTIAEALLAHGHLSYPEAMALVG